MPTWLLLLRHAASWGAVVLPILAADPVFEIDFTGGHPAPGWTATHDVAALEAHASGLTVPITGSDPFITSPPLTWHGRGEVRVELRLWSDSGGTAQLFWFHDTAGENQSIHFQIRSNAWTDVCLPLPPLRDGVRFRLDPPGTNGFARLAWIRIREQEQHALQNVRADGTNLILSIAPGEASRRLWEVPPGASLSTPERWFLVQTPDRLPGGTLSIPRWVTEGAVSRDRIVSGFVLQSSHPVLGQHPVGPIRHVEDFHDIPRLHPPAVVSRGKKGLQVQMPDDAIALGVKHAALNVDLPSLMELGASGDAYSWVMDGVTYRFRKTAVDAIPVKVLSDNGAVVTLILLAYASGDAARDAIGLHPAYDRRAPNRLGAFNCVTPEGARWFRATLEFLADRFSQADGRHGRASWFIIGNEVTAHWYWANMGEVPPSVFIAQYQETVRLANAAVQKTTDSIRVCLSFDHHWNLTYGNDPRRAIPGRRLLEGFDRFGRMGGNFEWHLAYHPYPENLFNPRTWKDASAWTTADTPRITFRNLEVLTAHLEQPELRWHGRSRRVLLSEQGFHSDGTPAGEQLQAAAYVYAWQKVDALEGIEAFILHRHVDHRDEGGLNLGLWRRREGSVADPASRKPIYEVFRQADTPGRAEAFRFALPLMGITNGPPVLNPRPVSVPR